jgi:hypothetical protein
MNAHLRLAGRVLPHHNGEVPGANRYGKVAQDPTGGIVHPLGRFASAGLISSKLAGPAVFFETYWGAAYV